MYFDKEKRRRARGEIRAEAATLGRLRSPRVTLVALAITTDAHPAAQWFGSIIALVMDVTEVLLLRQLPAEREVRVFLSDGTTWTCFDEESLNVSCWMVVKFFKRFLKGNIE